MKVTEEQYRVRVHSSRKSNVHFTLRVNGQDIGTFNSSGVNDITPQVHPGRNEIEVQWTNDHDRASYATSTLVIETQREENEEWNTLFSREVRNDTSETETRAAFTVGTSTTMMADRSPLPTATEPPKEEMLRSLTSHSAVVPIPSSTPDKALSTSRDLKERYIVKVVTSSLAPGEFTLTLNGEDIGSFNSRANQDITALVKPGKNVVVIRHAATKEIANRFSESTLTIGVERDGKWSTVANQAIRKDQPKAEKTFRFVAK